MTDLTDQEFMTLFHAWSDSGDVLKGVEWAVPAVEQMIEAREKKAAADAQATWHDDQCESEYETGAHAYTPCGCQVSRPEAEGLVRRAESSERRLADALASLKAVLDTKFFIPSEYAEDALIYADDLRTAIARQ